MHLSLPVVVSILRFSGALESELMLTYCLHLPSPKAVDAPHFLLSLARAAICLVPPEDLGLLYWVWLCCQGM